MESQNPLLQSKLVYQTRVGETEVKFWTGFPTHVEILSATPEAHKLIALGMRAYRGAYYSDITNAEIEQYYPEAAKTPLATPIEWINFVILLRRVPRYFTHQLVRTRIGVSFVQESTRLITKGSPMEFLLPRNLATVGREKAIESILKVIEIMQTLFESDQIQPEDIRTLLPQSFLTHVIWQINLKALQNVYNHRFCCQAEQTVWLPLLITLRKKIREWNPFIENVFISSPFERGEDCGFNASFDRPCVWRKTGTWET
jgi:thymidylate synthase (FAD)